MARRGAHAYFPSSMSSIDFEELAQLPLLRGRPEAPKAQDENRHTANPSAVSFDGLFVKRIWRLLCILKAYPVLILAALSILEAFLVSKVGAVVGKFYKIFLAQDRAKFWSCLWNAVALFLGVVTIRSTTDWLAEFLALCWRRTLTEHLQELYCKNKNYYWLEAVDNPDQRIAQDLSMFCKTLGELARVLASVPFSVVWYTYLAHRETQSWPVVSAAFLSFAASFIILKMLISPIASLVFSQEQCEGDYRIALIRLKQQKMEVAASQADETEHSNLNDKLNKLLNYQGKVVVWHWLLDVCMKILDYWGSLLTYGCIGAVVFSGGFSNTQDESSGAVAERISNSSFYLLTLIHSFTKVQDSSQKLSSLAGLTPRVAQLLEGLTMLEDRHARMEEMDKDAPDMEPDMGNNVLSISNLTCTTGGGDLIVEDLTVELEEGGSLLIMGANGVGKSTLLMVLTGLKDRLGGQIHAVPSNKIMMLPQTPVFAPGPLLADQLIYPSSGPLDDHQTLKLLDSVGLTYTWRKWVNDDLSQPRNWKDILSPGEIQRIGIARVLYHMPSLVLLDESTSALPVDVERILYTKLRSLGIALLSVGHRPSLELFHDKILKLQGVGKWQLVTNNGEFEF